MEIKILCRISNAKILMYLLNSIFFDRKMLIANKLKGGLIMIPKIIHYCWFGGNPLPPLATKCMESWKKYCGEFEIKEWNETNFDINMTNYSKGAAIADKWAFVADVARFYVMYNYGGIYFDVDVEIVKPIDKLLNSDMFIGFESEHEINTGQGFGAEKNFYLVEKMLDTYKEMPFINPDGTYNTTPSPKYTSAMMKSEGFVMDNIRQTIGDIEVYPSEYFCPKEWRSGEVEITENTHTIHHFMASWWSEEEKKGHESKMRFHKMARRYQRANQNKEI